MVSSLLFTLPSALAPYIQIDLHTNMQNNISSIQSNGLTSSFYYQLIYEQCFLLLSLFLIPFCIHVILSFKHIQVLKRDISQHETSIYKSTGDMAVSQVLLCVSLSFCISYLPSLVIHLIQLMEGNHRSVCGHIQFYLSAFCTLCIAINSSLKFFILCLFDRNFFTKIRTICCVKKQLEVAIYNCTDMSEMTLISNIDTHNN